jgi:polysaccharide biosynthesis/export protein
LAKVLIWSAVAKAQIVKQDEIMCVPLQAAKIFLFIACICCTGQVMPNSLSSLRPTGVTTGADNPKAGNAYLLGPEDVLSIRVLNREELGDAPYPIDLRGEIGLPRVGRVHAAGLTVEQLEARLVVLYRDFLQKPIVNIQVVEYHSQPISILGAVAVPGVHQIRGRRTLLEIVSEAAGLKADAGSTIEITRQKAWGPIPLSNNALDSSEQFFTASVSIYSLMGAKNPKENILVMPWDVITVPKAEFVYVIGAVKRAGAFALSEKSDLSILEAVSLADGLERTAAPRSAKILRPDRPSGDRRAIQVDLKQVLAGKGADVRLLPNDILFVPSSTSKVVSLRAIDALVTTSSGLAIYHPF